MALRPVGDIMLDMETLLTELTSDHDMQMGEILALVKGWVEIHSPDSIEEYTDDSCPVYFYGHKDVLKSFANKKRS